MKGILEYTEVDKKVISTSKVIKASFKNAFEELDKNDFVILENKRREDKMVLINLSSYSKLLKEIEEYKKIINKDNK